MKYILCYTENYDEGRNTKVDSEDFDDFTEAVMRYTLMCGGRDHVVLASVDDCKIISQFSRERADKETGAVPSVFIR